MPRHSLSALNPLTSGSLVRTEIVKASTKAKRGIETGEEGEKEEEDKIDEDSPLKCPYWFNPPYFCKGI